MPRNGASAFVTAAPSSHVLNLDTDDNEPSAFVYHLARAIESAAPSLGRNTIELLKASNLLPPRSITLL